MRILHGPTYSTVIVLTFCLFHWVNWICYQILRVWALTITLFFVCLDRKLLARKVALWVGQVLFCWEILLPLLIDWLEMYRKENNLRNKRKFSGWKVSTNPWSINSLVEKLICLTLFTDPISEVITQIICWVVEYIITYKIYS